MHPKLLLVFSTVLIASGLVLELGPLNTVALPALHVVLPVGAALLGLYLIKLILAKEETALAAELKPQAVPATRPRGKTKH